MINNYFFPNFFRHLFSYDVISDVIVIVRRVSLPPEFHTQISIARFWKKVFYLCKCSTNHTHTLIYTLHSTFDRIVNQIWKYLIFEDNETSILVINNIWIHKFLPFLVRILAAKIDQGLLHSGLIENWNNVRCLEKLDFPGCLSIRSHYCVVHVGTLGESSFQYPFQSIFC